MLVQAGIATFPGGCLEILKISDPSKTVMIGDTLGDELAAKTAGVDFVGVDYGFGFKKFKYIKQK